MGGVNFHNQYVEPQNACHCFDPKILFTDQQLIVQMSPLVDKVRTATAASKRAQISTLEVRKARVFQVCHLEPKNGIVHCGILN